MVIDRIVIFRELTKSYSRAKGLNYSKDNALQQTITVLKSFKDGGYQIQNSSRQAVTEMVVRQAAEQGWGLYEISPERLSLEQIFMELTCSEAAVA